MKGKKALIIGSEGQDGRLLSALLTDRKYCVFGLSRSKSNGSTAHFMHFDLTQDDFTPLLELIRIEKFDELYYIAAFHHSSQQSSSAVDLTFIDLNFRTNLTAFGKTLEILKEFSPPTRVFYASSSLIYSNSGEQVQNESTIPQPNCYYSIAKAAAMQVAKHYRKNHALFVSTGILYNHESILRKEQFLSKKIILDTHRLLRKEIAQIQVGDLEAITDWGYAPDYVEAMHHILQLNTSDDFIISSGVPHKVKDWFEIIFSNLNLKWQDYVVENKSLVQRKKPVLIGDNSKLKATGWEPKVSFEEMLDRMFNNRI